MNKHTIIIHRILFVLSVALSGVLIFSGFSEALDYWPVLWITLGMDAYLIGYAIEYVVSLSMEHYPDGKVAMVTVGILTCIPGLPGLYLQLFGKGWDDLAAFVLLFYFALPLLITTMVCMILWLVRRRCLKTEIL